MNILGYTLVEGKLTPLQDKIEAILKLDPATTKKAWRLGLAGCYRSMQPNLPKLPTASWNPFEKNQPEKVRWEEKHSQALQTIKNNLTSKPMLTGPKFDREFLIFTDATQRTAADFLSQRDDDGSEKVIAYASRKLLDREQKYSSIERECLSIIFALTKWEQWLWGHKVKVITDHAPLQYLARNLAVWPDGVFFYNHGIYPRSIVKDETISTPTVWVV